MRWHVVVEGEYTIPVVYIQRPWCGGGPCIDQQASRVVSTVVHGPQTLIGNQSRDIANDKPHEAGVCGMKGAPATH